MNGWRAVTRRSLILERGIFLLLFCRIGEPGVPGRVTRSWLERKAHQRQPWRRKIRSWTERSVSVVAGNLSYLASVWSLSLALSWVRLVSLSLFAVLWSVSFSLWVFWSLSLSLICFFLVFTLLAFRWSVFLFLSLSHSPASALYTSTWKGEPGM